MTCVSVEGRDVYLVARRKQTVRVCTELNTRGVWEHEFGLDERHHVTADQVEAHEKITDLVDWLLARGARQESSLTAAARVPRAPLRVDPDPAWLEEAIPAVERAIDELVNEFVEHPYLHRVEHSLHVRLFQLLAAQPIFGAGFPIGVSGYSTQSIHKEWPETTRRGTKNGRGNVDLAVLSPNQLASAAVEDYRGGHIAAAIVIEMGLDYGYGHLAGDHAKLLNSEVSAGYLVDFRRSGRPDPETRRLILDPCAPIRTAYVHHHPAGTAFKSVADTELRYRTR